MSRGAESDQWWGWNGRVFVVRDLSMVANKDRKDGRIVYFNSEKWIPFFSDFQTITKELEFSWVGKVLKEEQDPNVNSITVSLASAEKYYNEQWERLDEKAMEFVHISHLEKYGEEITYPTFSKTPDSYRRTAHCWACQTNLDSQTDYKCNSCRWILCRCGACGCGYRSR
jgi:hypothetical protein